MKEVSCSKNVYKDKLLRTTTFTEKFSSSRQTPLKNQHDKVANCHINLTNDSSGIYEHKFENNLHFNLVFEDTAANGNLSLSFCFVAIFHICVCM